MNPNQLESIRWVNFQLQLLDQRLLPEQRVYIDCPTVNEVYAAIKTLAVRGAPAIGVAAALGVAVAAQNAAKIASSDVEFFRLVNDAIKLLESSRPTAVNLFWALQRMRQCLQVKHLSISESLNLICQRANQILINDQQINKRLSEIGAKLLADNAVVLTHCNAGILATSGHGTALGVIYSAVNSGKSINVYACETRPLLQGARLTTYELMQANIPVTLITDSMAGYIMANEKIDAIIVGADRIAANGDVANKIGTYTLAVLAEKHQIPFYVASPISTFDLTLANGNLITVEERAGEEVTHHAGVRLAPEGIAVRNPAFDITPAELITAIITERGAIRKPNSELIANLLK